MRDPRIVVVVALILGCATPPPPPPPQCAAELMGRSTNKCGEELYAYSKELRSRYRETVRSLAGRRKGPEGHGALRLVVVWDESASSPEICQAVAIGSVQLHSGQVASQVVEDLSELAPAPQCLANRSLSLTWARLPRETVEAVKRECLEEIRTLSGMSVNAIEKRFGTEDVGDLFDECSWQKMFEALGAE